MRCTATARADAPYCGRQGPGARPLRMMPRLVAELCERQRLVGCNQRVRALHSHLIERWRMSSACPLIIIAVCQCPVHPFALAASQCSGAHMPMRGSAPPRTRMQRRRSASAAAGRSFAAAARVHCHSDACGFRQHSNKLTEQMRAHQCGTRNGRRQRATRNRADRCARRCARELSLRLNHLRWNNGNGVTVLQMLYCNFVSSQSVPI